MTERAGWDLGSIPLWPRLGDVCPCTGAWSALFPRKGMLSLSRDATGVHLPEKHPFTFPGSCLHSPEGAGMEQSLDS